MKRTPVSDIAAGIRGDLGDDWLPTLYATKVRTLRTRSLDLDIPERENDATILHTLLGIELKVGRRRYTCPDLATARYMLIFARLGCRQFAVPYDITKISVLADELETSWQQTALKLVSATAKLTTQARSRARGRTLKSIREELAEIGPGDRMPEFKQSTRQRQT